MIVTSIKLIVVSRRPARSAGQNETKSQNRPLRPLPTLRRPGAGRYLRGMDGTLRRVTDRTWQGDLNGYRVTVSQLTHGGWYYHVMAPSGSGQRCTPADSLADGARRAREYVEANPLASA